MSTSANTSTTPSSTSVSTSPGTNIPMTTTGLNATNATTTIDIKVEDEVQFYVGLLLAIVSNSFIGASYIFKKRGLIRAAKDTNTHAADGSVQYLRDWVWWTGMIMMAVGEVANFVAYGFAPATLVTPLGALSVIVAAVLSARFLNESLNLFGQVGCVLCVIGSTMIVCNAPQERSIHHLQELAPMLADPGFLVYVVLIIIGDSVLIFYCSPRWGTSNPFVYVGITGTLASLTVMSCKALGIACSQLFSGDTQVAKFWLMWFSLVVAALCISIQMNYLNRALDAFNTAVVTPILYVIFTTCVLITSALLLKEWGSLSGVAVLNIICGFLIVIVAIFLISVFKEIDLDWRAVYNFLFKRDASAMRGVTINRRKTNNVNIDGFTELSEISRSTSIASADVSYRDGFGPNGKYRRHRNGSSDSEVPTDQFTEPPVTRSEVGMPYAAASADVGFTNPAFAEEPLAVNLAALATASATAASTVDAQDQSSAAAISNISYDYSRPATNLITTHALTETPSKSARPFVFLIDTDIGNPHSSTPAQNDDFSPTFNDRNNDPFVLRLEDSTDSRNLFLDQSGRDVTADGIGSSPFVTSYSHSLLSSSVV